ncbi:hypothetical protein VB737_08510 [Synechococcus sp. BA-120 BA3]|nr:hypothetical protein [Synechococcus sp. BA-120 BA3]
MLFRSAFHEGLRSGAITLAFRRWRRPSVRAGGTLLTPVGQLEMASVDPVALETISAAELLDEWRRGHEGEVYRIALGPLHPDPRLALRRDAACRHGGRHCCGPCAQPGAALSLGR